jgi:ribonuclease HI
MKRLNPKFEFPKENLIECYFDGACAPQNPCGYMGYGAIVIKDNQCVPLFDGQLKHPSNSNNVAEYLAFELVLDNLEGTKNRNIQVYGDSQLVVKQMTHRWRIKEGLYKDTALRCYDKLAELWKDNNIRINWIPREQNTDADELSNEGIKKVCGQYYDFSKPKKRKRR